MPVLTHTFIAALPTNCVGISQLLSMQSTACIIETGKLAGLDCADFSRIGLRSSCSTGDLQSFAVHTICSRCMDPGAGSFTRLLPPTVFQCSACKAILADHLHFKIGHEQLGLLSFQGEHVKLILCPMVQLADAYSSPFGQTARGGYCPRGISSVQNAVALRLSWV